ncbi:unnamed protein product, partial [Mesorhabditis belari]|uniref:Uncharacterized protein n=1 Tax=Mesorhabditis belari TaxID=2138241 RepID=A0AAF3E9V5_9BILA
MTILIMDLIAIGKTENDSFSIQWLLTNLKFGMVLHGVASAGFMAALTAKHVFQQLEQQYAALSLRIPSNTRMRAVVLTVMFVFTIILMLVVVSNAADDTSTWIKGGSPISFKNIWGADPFIRIVCGLFSCLSTVIYILAFGGITQQFRGFNEELRTAANEADLTYDSLISFVQRQKELLAMVRYVNDTFGKLVNLGAIGAFIAHVTAVAIFVGHRSSLTGGQVALMIGYLVISGNLMASLLYVPGMLNAQVQELRDILILKSNVGLSKNEMLLPLVNHMVQRAEAPENKLCFLHTFLIDLRIAHRLTLAMLPLGNILIFLGRIYGVQQ